MMQPSRLSSASRHRGIGGGGRYFSLFCTFSSFGNKGHNYFLVGFSEVSRVVMCLRSAAKGSTLPVVV